MENVPSASVTISLPTGRGHLPISTRFPAWRETPGDSQTDGRFGGRRWLRFHRNTVAAWAEEEREPRQTYDKELGFNSTLKGTPSAHTHTVLNTITTTFTEPLGVDAALGFLQVRRSVRGDYGIILGNAHSADTLIHDGEVLNDTLRSHFLKNFEASNIPF